MTRRRRNSVLEAVEAFQREDPAVTLFHLRAFLYVCENEGLSISELAQVCRTTCATASRTVQALGARRRSPGAVAVVPLVETRASHGDSKQRQVFLTTAGEQLRERLDGHIQQARLIAAA